ncbi:YeiH family putative sulfate export transporter [Rhizobium deserti]|uniref:YeiH family putative sulfate export transporter n=1 Tax=Rhizobium deserti TaxID=2547961 RepID=A0A4R5UN54_9HYPH|nr:YeiH family protein [Rhizobium deserti]TDK39164.1 YeiH family putative sulfate export transporter [Rhizobium deserti]
MSNSCPAVIERTHWRQLSSAGMRKLLPGMLLATAVACAALAIRGLTGWIALSPLILSIVIGLLIRSLVTLPYAVTAGLGFSIRHVLRFGIVLLGFQITATQILSLGGSGILLVVLTLASTFVAIRWMGRLIGVDPSLTDLIAAGTSVCGASAVIAANAAVRGKQEHVAYAVACVTLFGSISMLVYPLLAQPLGLDPLAYGLWTGATIHEVAQVVAAAFQGGDVSGEFGTISKLARVVMLAPLVLTMAFSIRSGPASGPRTTIPMPWFVLGFLMTMFVNSAISVPPDVSHALAVGSSLLLSVALAAMGLQTDIRRLGQEGWKPLALGAFGWLFISVFGYLLVRLFGF